MADNGEFTINGIQLYIPPESISVNRQSVNYEWQTLRTRASQKAKSGLSTIQIVLKVLFTDNMKTFVRGNSKVSNNGVHQLRRLIASFKATPFCHISNDFLRNSLLDGKLENEIVLAINQCSVTKKIDPSGVNIIECEFAFNWFNYFPYMHQWKYKKIPFELKDTNNTSEPSNSQAWQLYVDAEEARGNYNRNIDTIGDDINIFFNSFAKVTVHKFKQVKAQVELSRRLLAQSKSKSEKILTETINSLLNNPVTRESKSEDIFGKETTFGAQMDEVKGFNSTYNEITDDIKALITGNTNNIISIENFIATEGGWKILSFKDDDNKESPIIHKTDIGASQKAETPASYQSDDMIILTKSNKIDTKQSGLISSGITLSFSNILATIPLIGHAYPTYQHLGNTDARIQIGFSTTNETSLKLLSFLYNFNDNQAINYRIIPSVNRNLIIQNDLLNLLGIKEVIIDGMQIDTIEGSPGTYSIALTLLENPMRNKIDAERLIPEGLFTTSNEIRNAVSNIIENNLTLKSGSIVQKSDTANVLNALGGAIKEVMWVILSAGNLQSNYTKSDPTVHELAKQEKVIETHQNTNANRSGNSYPEYGIAVNQGYYLYSGKDSEGDAYFKSICIKYALKKSDLLVSIFNLLASNPESVERLVNLNNQVVMGIESILKDLKNVIANARIRNEESKAVIQDDEIQNIDDNIYAALAGWNEFIYNFIDYDLSLGNAFDLPQFASIKAIIVGTVLKSGGDCYPDLPLKEVAKLVKEFYPSYSDMLDNFLVKSGLSLKRIGASALINPDFYFSNEMEKSDFIIKPDIIAAIVAGVTATNRAMIEERRDYFLGAYKNSLGKEIYDKTEKDSLFQNEDKAIYQGKDLISFENSSKENYISIFNNQKAQISKTGVTPNQLQGQIGPAIASTDANGQTLRLSDIQLNEGIEKSNDEKNPKDDQKHPKIISNNFRSGQVLAPQDYAFQCKHDFDITCLDKKPESYYRSKKELDSAEQPNFQWPLDVNYREVKVDKNGNDTASFQKNRPNPAHGGKIRDHKGVDLTSLQDGAVNGQVIKASADGVVVGVNYDKDTKFSRERDIRPFDIENQKLGDEGIAIIIEHKNKYLTKYFHMQWNNETEAISKAFYNKNGEFSETQRKEMLTVKSGQPIGKVGMTGGATGPHLHFEIWDNGTAIDPIPILNGLNQKSTGPLALIDHTADSLFTKSIEQYTKELKNGQGLTINRAFPTFKLFFIQSDAGKRSYYGFDDFYSYSCIKEIEVIRNSKIAADLCKIIVTNISGVLSNRKFYDVIAQDKARGPDAVSSKDPKNRATVNTVNENNIKSLMMQTGTQVQLRLGYNNNPEELETVFDGQIVEVQFAEGGDLIEITCQSFATELVQNIHGESTSIGGLLDSTGLTGHIIEELLASPETVHFGRWEPSYGANDNVRGLLTNRWTPTPRPSCDNIFAPEQGEGILGMFRTSAKFVLYRSTIWDILQEMTLRVPSYIVSVVPYMDKYGPRNTLFFGSPDQLYFSRDATHQETNIIDILKKISEKQVPNTTAQAQSDIVDPTKTPTLQDKQRAMDLDKNALSENYFQSTGLSFALDKSLIKPFRNYHVATSGLHIISNNIEMSEYGVFNQVSVNYSSGKAVVDEPTQQLSSDDNLTCTLKADAGIPDEFIREILVQYPNAVGYENAKTYALSVLWNCMKEAYKGELTLIGNPKIKPYDIIYIFDEYTDMYGPVEVQQVIHKFSHESGFITEITPNLIVNINQQCSMATSKAMNVIVEESLSRMGLGGINSLTNGDPVTGISVLAAGTAGALAGAAFFPEAVAGAIVVGGLTTAANFLLPPLAKVFGLDKQFLAGKEGVFTFLEGMTTTMFKDLITRTQLGHPFHFQPLILSGKPMIAGLPNRFTDASFISRLGRWSKDAKDGYPLLIDRWYDAMQRLPLVNQEGKLRF